MAENQSDHRMGLEKSVIKSQIWQSYIGQFFALIVSLTTIGCSTYVILQGFEWPGSILGSLGLVGLVYVFIQGQRSQNKDLAIKKQQVQKR